MKHVLLALKLAYADCKNSQRPNYVSITKLYKRLRKNKFIYKYSYRGRFAPSPTGPLHYGSLVAALASYLQARSHYGEWFVRIENIDPPREVKGAINSILQTLIDFDFRWDAKPILQSHRIPFHRHVACKLLQNGNAYLCKCSRKDLAKLSKTGPMGLVYPGTCSEKNLNRIESNHNNLSIRLRTNNAVFSYTDEVYGLQNCDLKNESGDYIIYRADELPSYILATSVDDLYEGYTQVVRGNDLLSITPRQLHLSAQLNQSAPSFMHIPVIVNDSGEKLSKQTHAPKIKKHHVRELLNRALADLGHEPPKSLRWRPVWATWSWAICNWNSDFVPRVESIKYQE
ncbi:MAG: tRNA glutamyl-Q(34) synthetase GluQRS [Pseudomonadota bacterium]